MLASSVRFDQVGPFYGAGITRNSGRGPASAVSTSMACSCSTSTTRAMRSLLRGLHRSPHHSQSSTPSGRHQPQRRQPPRSNRASSASVHGHVLHSTVREAAGRHRAQLLAPSSCMRAIPSHSSRTMAQPCSRSRVTVARQRHRGDALNDRVPRVPRQQALPAEHVAQLPVLRRRVVRVDALAVCVCARRLPCGLLLLLLLPSLRQTVARKS